MHFDKVEDEEDICKDKKKTAKTKTKTNNVKSGLVEILKQNWLMKLNQKPNLKLQEYRKKQINNNVSNYLPDRHGKI